MRKWENYARLLSPFSFSTHNEVINNYSCSICEISELCFPNNQRIRVCYWVAIFESQNTILTQMTVSNSHIIGYCFKENMFFSIFALITNESMSVWKSTSLYILSWYSNTVSFLQQRSPGQLLHGGPVQRLLIFETLDSFFINSLYCRMNVEISRPGCDILKNFD